MDAGVNMWTWRVTKEQDKELFKNVEANFQYILNTVEISKD